MIGITVEGAFANPSQIDLQVHVMAAVGSVLPNLDPDATT